MRERWIESGERASEVAREIVQERREASAQLRVDERMSANSTVDTRGNDRHRREGPAHLSPEADNRRATEPLRYRGTLSDSSRVAPFPLRAACPKGGSRTSDRTRVIL